MRPSPFQALLENQTISLFILDGLANVIDFAFHFWMGRVLIPSDFAILQTLNSIMLVYVTASGVFQPVVGRFVAEARGRGQPESIPAIFQSFLQAAFRLGTGLGLVVLLLSEAIGAVLNLPVWTIRLSALLILLSTIRPIAAGLLQGQENFISFGLTRLALSVGRITIVFFLLQAGLGLTGAVLALPFGWFVSVVLAFLLLKRSVWIRTRVVPGILKEGWKLSAFALLAYIAYMSLTSLDLVWVNRNLAGDEAGAYAGLVLLRRVIALLPGVAVTVMFPRIARTLAEGRSTDRLLLQTGGIILISGGVLALAYFAFASQIIAVVFGPTYVPAAPLLGWMGLSMIGISLSSIWLNYYLAEKPARFVVLLISAVLVELTLLALFPDSLEGAVAAFGTTGWLLTSGGLALYRVRKMRDRAQAVP